MSNNITITSCDPAIIHAELVAASPYGYVPTHWVGIFYVVLFAITTALHFGQAIWYRLWFLLPTAVLCGVLELVGWAGRLWSSINTVNCLDPSLSNINVVKQNPFLMQIVTTIIAPTPLLAANFVLLGRIIQILGPRYSRLGARLYSIIFLSCDIIALVVQGSGGGIAASAATGDTSTQDLGGHIMLGGIVFQLAVIVVYSFLAIEFLVRYVKDQPVRKSEVFDKRIKTSMRMKLLLFGMSLMAIFLFIRSVYRTVELAGGWTGTIITTEWFFDTWDAAMIVLAMATLNLLHPGFLLIPELEMIMPSSDSIQRSSESYLASVKNA